MDRLACFCCSTRFRTQSDDDEAAPQWAELEFDRSLIAILRQISRVIFNVMQ